MRTKPQTFQRLLPKEQERKSEGRGIRHGCVTRSDRQRGSHPFNAVTSFVHSLVHLFVHTPRARATGTPDDTHTGPPPPMTAKTRPHPGVGQAPSDSETSADVQVRSYADDSKHGITKAGKPPALLRVLPGGFSGGGLQIARWTQSAMTMGSENP